MESRLILLTKIKNRELFDLDDIYFTELPEDIKRGLKLAEDSNQRISEEIYSRIHEELILEYKKSINKIDDRLLSTITEIRNNLPILDKCIDDLAWYRNNKLNKNGFSKFAKKTYESKVDTVLSACPEECTAKYTQAIKFIDTFNFIDINDGFSHYGYKAVKEDDLITMRLLTDKLYKNIEIEYYSEFIPIDNDSLLQEYQYQPSKSVILNYLNLVETFHNENKLESYLLKWLDDNQEVYQLKYDLLRLYKQKHTTLLTTIVGAINFYIELLSIFKK